MAINIKELFNTDSENIRLDKINYNFDQIVAGGGGPIGLQGSKGEVGPQGLKGEKGSTGSTGVKGEPGVATDYFIRTEHSADNNYMLAPIADPNHNTSPVLILGDFVEVGPLADYAETPLYVKANQDFSGAIRVGTENIADYVDIQPLVVSGYLEFNFNPGPLTPSVKYRFKGHSVTVEVGGIDKVVLGDTSTYNGDAVFNAGFKFSPGAGLNKYLRSDAAGNASWQTFPTTLVPIGTMVMVSKFVLDNSVDWAGNGSNSLNWRGRGTGNWAGWYYCWGKEWGSYKTPDMRERYPIGFVEDTYIDFTGTSNESKYAAEGGATHSTAGTSGYFGVRDIDGLQATDVKYAHSHTSGINYKFADTAVPGDSTYDTPVLVGNTSGPYGGSENIATSNSTGDADGIIDISPRSAVVGFMIYLGSATLNYDNTVDPGLKGE